MKSEGKKISKAENAFDKLMEDLVLMTLTEKENGNSI